MGDVWSSTFCGGLRGGVGELVKSKMDVWVGQRFGITFEVSGLWKEATMDQTVGCIQKSSKKTSLV